MSAKMGIAAVMANSIAFLKMLQSNILPAHRNAGLIEKPRTKASVMETVAQLDK